ncbi:MAG: hypothetical protein ACLTW7_12780 [Enterococcus sp.]|uniref:hypothetical protein n=1 Tax=Enterococcus sp. TaxID=35783 RepID=UPI0039921A95
MLDDFKKQYIEKVLNGSGFDDELNSLFETILLEKMNDDPEKMGTLIQSIVDENTDETPSELEELRRENKELKEWKEITEPKMDAIMEALSKLTGEELI